MRLGKSGSHMFGGQFANKKVWLSGHTGFKGSWLATWLLQLGARVHGFALEPPTKADAAKAEAEVTPSSDREARSAKIN